MENLKVIKFVRSSESGPYRINLNGFRVGVILTDGHVVNNHGQLMAQDPVTGLSRLLGLTITEAVEVFNRESWFATQEVEEAAVSKPVSIDLTYLDSVRRMWSRPLFCTGLVWNQLSDVIAAHGYDLNALLDQIWLHKQEAALKAPYSNVLFFELQVGREELDLKARTDPNDPTRAFTIMLAGERG